jgi:hypothetical protein
MNPQLARLVLVLVRAVITFAAQALLPSLVGRLFHRCRVWIGRRWPHWQGPESSGPGAADLEPHELW